MIRTAESMLAIIGAAAVGYAMGITILQIGGM